MKPSASLDARRNSTRCLPVAATRLSVQLHLARHFDEAIAECRRTIELDRDFSVAYEVLGASLAAKGMYRDALPYVEKAVELNPHNAMSRAYLGYVYGSMGNRAKALGIVDELTAASKERFTPALSFAVVYTGLGQKDLAFAWLDKAYEERFNRLAYLKREPVWDRLRSDSRFEGILRRIGLPE